MSLARALPWGPGQLSTVPGSPPALTPGTRPAPGRRAGCVLPVPLAGTPGMEPGARGWKAPGERGLWGARPLGGLWRERVAKALMGSPGPRGAHSPGRLNPLPRAGPLFLPLGGVQSPEGGLASLETLCFLSSRVCLCLSLCPTSVSLSLHPTLSSHCALGESRGSRRAPPPQLGPPGAGWGAQGTRGAGGCSRVIPG